MAMQSARPCPNCGIPLPPGTQRFCPNCGNPVDGEAASKQTERTPGSAQQMAPPPPTQQYPPYQTPETYQQQPIPGTYQQPVPANYQQPMQSYQQPPAYTRPQKDSSGKVLGQMGCGMLAVILVIVGLCGGSLWFAWYLLSNAANDSSRNSNYSNNSTNNSNKNTAQTPVQTVSKTIQLNNQSIVYAGVKFIFKDAQQANFFKDDSSSDYQTDGVLRLNYHEENPSSRGAFYYPPDVFRLQLPDQTAITPLNLLNGSAPAGATSRDNWIDFKVAQSVDVTKAVLRLGKDSEAQMDVPLTGKADLSKYQDKTSQPNKQTQNRGATVTLTQARTTWSYQVKQADKGTMFIVLNLRIDNNSSKDFYGYPPDYMRVKVGGTTNTPTGDNTIPSNVPVGITNKTGEIAFLVPQGSTNFTLILLSDTAGGAPSTIDFQV